MKFGICQQNVTCVWVMCGAHDEVFQHWLYDPSEISRPLHSLHSIPPRIPTRFPKRWHFYVKNNFSNSAPLLNLSFLRSKNQNTPDTPPKAKQTCIYIPTHTHPSYLTSKEAIFALGLTIFSVQRKFLRWLGHTKSDELWGLKSNTHTISQRISKS